MSREARSRTDCVVARLEGFLVQQGLERDLRAPWAIEAFLAVGLLGRAPSTKGTYRSVLRQSNRDASAPALAYSGSRAPAPYAEDERAELFSIARAQRLLWRRHSALSLLTLSIGAGLRAAEIIATTGRDVSLSTDRSNTVRLMVKGQRPRTITVLTPYAALLVDLASLVRDDFLFRPGPADRSYPNFISDFGAHLVRDPSSLRCSVARGRSSFICDRLALDTPLDVLCKEVGITEVESLLRYARHVPHGPQSKAGLRKRLREQTGTK